jgi:hypothetical protein
MSQQTKSVSFSLTCPDPRAWLVVTSVHRTPRVVEMQHRGPSTWSACTNLVPGEYHCRYYSGDDRNVFYHSPAHIEGSTDDGMDALVSVRVPEEKGATQFIH